MNTKHTPAPWAVTNKGSFVVTKHATICRLFGRDDSDYPNSEANAKLIAAAPELLEALQDLTWLIEQGAMIEEIQEAIKAKALPAIKKATE